MRITNFAGTAILLCGPLVTASAQTPRLPADSVEIGRRASGWFMSGQIDSLLTLFPKASAETITDIRTLSEQFRSRAGQEASLIEERWVWRSGMRQYWRIIDVTGGAPEPVVLRWIIRSDGTLGGAGLNMLSNVPPVDSVSGRPRE